LEECAGTDSDDINSLYLSMTYQDADALVVPLNQKTIDPYVCSSNYIWNVYSESILFVPLIIKEWKEQIDSII
jgi:hypothetical protein